MCGLLGHHGFAGEAGSWRGTEGSVCVQQAGLTISEKDVTPCGLESSSSSSTTAFCFLSDKSCTGSDVIHTHELDTHSCDPQVNAPP